MDGFSSREGVIVLAATNQPDVLDKALLRPGRFDRRVIVNLPDKTGREAIMKVHTRNVPLGGDVRLAELAATTPGFSGADIKNLVNEAALLAARRDQADVREKDFLDALEKIVLGPERPLLLTREDRERIAYHESGHAILGLVVPGADPVHRVTIVPRGQALGVTYQRPQTERYNYPEAYLRARIVGMLGGRAAEEVVYGTKTTGAESDIEQATALARSMVTRWGMSDALGMVQLAPRQNPYIGGPAIGGEKPFSEETARVIDTRYSRSSTRATRRRSDCSASIGGSSTRSSTLYSIARHSVRGDPQGHRTSACPRARERPSRGCKPRSAGASDLSLKELFDMPITIERVLVATDFSKAGQRAVNVAAEWARQTHAQLRIVHVTPTKGWLSSAWGITSSVAEVIQSHAASALKQVAESADPSRPLELSTGVLSGPAARSIVRAAREYIAHLLVVGARGERDADGESVLGGTSAKLLETAETPLLLVRQARKDPVAGVVAAVDLSPHSHAVLEWADFASAERHLLSITSMTCRSQRGSRHMAYLRPPSMSKRAGPLTE